MRSLILIVVCVLVCRSASAGECDRSDEALGGLAPIRQKLGEDPSVVTAEGLPVIAYYDLDHLGQLSTSFAHSRDWAALICGADHDDVIAWIDRWDVAIAAEKAVKATSDSQAAQVCEVMGDRDAVRHQIAIEKANPAGVVDLVLLHSLGQSLQALTLQADALQRVYVKDRKKPVTAAVCARLRADAGK